MNNRRDFLCLGTTALLTALLPRTALAGPFPARPINWIVPFSPGGGGDRWSRVLSSVALDVMDQPLRVRNMPGDSATLGWKHMLDQPADGHTALIASPTPLIALTANPNPAFSPADVKIVCFISAFNAIFVAQPGRPWSTWSGLVDHARANPNSLKFGMTYADLTGAALALSDAGVKAQLIPYSSTSTGVIDMLGGDIDVTSVTPSTALTMYPDQVATLLNATEMPLPGTISNQLGNPPHAVELGYQTINYPRWIGVHPDTPDELVADLSEKIGLMLTQHSFKTIMRKMGEEIIFVPHDEAQAQYKKILEGVRVAVKAF